jgi:quercetin dioxygenase-like cupin family protein
MKAEKNVVISKTMAAVDYNFLEMETFIPGISYAPVIAGDLGASLMLLDAGIKTDFHTHSDPQISFVVSGRIRYIVEESESQEHVYEAGPSCLVAISGDVRHRLEVLETAQVVECWAPANRHHDVAVVRI